VKHFILFYDVVPDYVERGAFRAEHLEKAWASHDRGELVLGARWRIPDGAVLIFKADSPDVVRQFAEADPTVVNGLVASWRVSGRRSAGARRPRPSGLGGAVLPAGTAARIARALSRSRRTTTFCPRILVPRSRR
jgi:hypothetical protein